jgi:hypothetical protein
MTFGLTQSLDAYVMVLPMAVIELLVSVLNLVLLVLILLFPLTAALSFFPFFRNAALNGLKKMLLLTALPAGLSIVLSIILYMLGQVDAPVAQAVTVAKVPSSFSFLVALIVALSLKAALLYGLWHYRDSVLDFLTGGVVSEHDLGNQLKDGLAHTFDAAANVGNGLEGGLLLGGGAAMMAGGGLGILAGNTLGQEELAEKFSDFMTQGKQMAGSGWGHFVPEGMKNKFQSDTEPNETPDDTTDEPEDRTSDFLAKETTENSAVDSLPDKNNHEAQQAEAHEAKAPITPFVLSDENEDLESQTAADFPHTKASSEADEAAHFGSSQSWESPIVEEADRGEWQGAIQDLSEERGGLW